jgi:hypothetical protein
VYWNAVSCTGAGYRTLKDNSLAMAEMTTLTAAIYRKYRTKRPKDQYCSVGPIITSRFEIFFDETDGREKVNMPSPLQ